MDCQLADCFKVFIGREGRKVRTVVRSTTGYPVGLNQKKEAGTLRRKSQREIKAELLIGHCHVAVAPLGIREHRVHRSGDK